MICTGIKDMDIMVAVYMVRNTVKKIRACPIVAQTMFPAAVMVFSIINSQGDVMLSHFFEECLKLNSEGFVALMRGMVAA
ncbi:Uncharacterized protein FKW44_021767, partial [Caligus rogercresseyi]